MNVKVKLYKEILPTLNEFFEIKSKIGSVITFWPGMRAYCGKEIVVTLEGNGCYYDSKGKEFLHPDWVDAIEEPVSRFDHLKPKYNKNDHLAIISFLTDTLNKTTEEFLNDN